MKNQSLEEALGGTHYLLVFIILLLVVICIAVILNLFVYEGMSDMRDVGEIFLTKEHYDNFCKDMPFQDAMSLTPLIAGMQTELQVWESYAATGCASPERKIITFDQHGNKMELKFLHDKLVSKSYACSIKNKATFNFIKKQWNKFRSK